MSKTYLDQMDKAKMLVGGLRKNYEQVKNLGIHSEDLATLEKNIAEGEKLNEEVERLRAEISGVLAQAHQKLSEVKETTVLLKRIVKQNYDMSRWMDFGVPDKR